jgi:hypothetical protein
MATPDSHLKATLLIVMSALAGATCDCALL